jgi:hypothetical protein
VAGRGKHSDRVVPAPFSRVDLDVGQLSRSFDLMFLMSKCSTNPLLTLRLSVMSTAAPSPIDVHHCGIPICIAVMGADRFTNQWRRFGRNSPLIATVTDGIRSFWTRSCGAKQSGDVLILVRQQVALTTGALPSPPTAGSCPRSACTPDTSLETSALGESLG